MTRNTQAPRTARARASTPSKRGAAAKASAP